MAGTIPEQGSIRPPRVRKQRLPPAPDEYITYCGPPDISCADIPEEQLSRTYSRSCVWDPQTNPVPPMQEMEGFGRFRRSVHADANWELCKFGGDLQALGPAAVLHLGDFEIARLKDGVMNNIRTPSFTSLASRSDSGESSTAPRVCRGFTPSTTSQAEKPGKDCSSSMSCTGSRTTSPDRIEGTGGQCQPHSKRMSFLRFDLGHAALPRIDERASTLQKKRTVPLIFDEQGTADDAIDDDEYESCEESFAPAEVPAEADNKVTTTVASNWHEKKAQKAQISQILLPNKIRGSRHYRTFDHVPEKARLGQKKSSKPVARRLSSCGGKVLAKRAASKENVHKAIETNPPVSCKAPTLPTNSIPSLVVFSPNAPSTSSAESAEENSARFDFFLADAKAKRADSNENNDVSYRSKSTSQTVTSVAPHSSHLSVAAGRKRSNTAIRVHSGNIPIVYLEGDVKQALDLREIDRNNLQPVAV